MVSPGVGTNLLNQLQSGICPYCSTRTILYEVLNTFHVTCLELLLDAFKHLILFSTSVNFSFICQLLYLSVLCANEFSYIFPVHYFSLQLHHV